VQRQFAKFRRDLPYVSRRSALPKEYWWRSGVVGEEWVNEIGQRTDISDEAVCGGLPAQELVVRSFYYRVFGHRNFWDALEL
jgi:hypothetical protein